MASRASWRGTDSWRDRNPSGRRAAHSLSMIWRTGGGPGGVGSGGAAPAVPPDAPGLTPGFAGAPGTGCCDGAPGVAGNVPAPDVPEGAGGGNVEGVN